MTPKWSFRVAGWAVAATAVLVASTPMPALGQRGLSNAGNAADAAVESTVAPTAQRPLQGVGPATERARLEQMREHMVSGMRRMAVRMAAIQDRLAALERGDESAPSVTGGTTDCEGRRDGRAGRSRGTQGQGTQGQGTQGQDPQGQRMKVKDGTGPACRVTPAPTPPTAPVSPADGERGGDR